MSINKTWAISSWIAFFISGAIIRRKLRLLLLSLVRPHLLFAGEKLSESRIVANRIPDRIDLETRDGNVPGKLGELPAKDGDGIGGRAGACLDFGEARQNIGTYYRIFCRRKK